MNNPTLMFCFKGTRTYVHGTDIVSALLEHFSGKQIKDIDLKFNGMASTQLTLLQGDEAQGAKVNIRVVLDGEHQVMQLVENGVQIDCRYDYDEDKIIQQCELNEVQQYVHLIGLTGYTLCENFVAMNKYLLQSLYPKEKGKWYFTRLEQKRIIEDDSIIAVKLIKNFNFRLIKSDILLGDEVIGSIYFTMAKDKE